MLIADFSPLPSFCLMFVWSKVDLVLLVKVPNMKCLIRLEILSIANTIWLDLRFIHFHFSTAHLPFCIDQIVILAR